MAEETTTTEAVKLKKQNLPLQGEWILLVNLATTALFLLLGGALLSNLENPLQFTLILMWLFAVILLSAFRIVHHAESLAVILGEPLGTLVLTLSVIGIEVMMISAVMLAAETNKPELARDTMFAVVMIINGMIGVSLLVGGLRHHEQTYNLNGANAFLALIVPLSILGLVLPNFTQTTPGPTLSPFQSIFAAVMSIGVYAVFLAVQTRRHKDYFIDPKANAEDNLHDHGEHSIVSLPFHAVLLLAYLLPLVILAKQLAVPIDYATRVFGAPPALGGFLVATLILSPEAMSAVRAAVNNQLQRSINILLGSVLATIGLTIPAVLTIGLFTGKTIYLGLSAANTILLVLVLALSTLTFSNNRTNVLFGAVHILLFLAYLMLIFES